MTARLRSGLWVQATIWRCSQQGIPATVVHRGDTDAGAVLVKLNRLEQGCMVLSQARTLDGELIWLRSIGPEPVPEADADAYIARQLKRDPDLWVLEIEDRDGRQFFDGRIE